MGIAVLVLWVLVALLGLTALIVWLRGRRPGSRFPVALVSWHVACALCGLALWGAFLAVGSVWWAWGAFGVLTVGNVLGDLMLTGRFRAVAGRSRGWSDYGAAIGETLRFRRPIPSLHALVGGVLYFLTLATCIVASLP
jgi:hypothetical protein